MAQKFDKFYVAIMFKDGKVDGHRFAFDHDKLLRSKEPSLSGEEKSGDKKDLRSKNKFGIVFDDFVSVMESYRKFMPLTLYLLPTIVKATAAKEIAEFAEKNGRLRSDFELSDQKIYELDQRFLQKFVGRMKNVTYMAEGALLLPQIVIVGLVSAYDAFLSSLLKVVISLHEEIVLTSQKEIAFSELLKFDSIEDAKSTLIDREIETVLRKSHHEQFDWMQSQFKVKLKENLSAWPIFIELCERRNLFTHTGGVISKQYLKNCKDNGVELGDRKAGQKLSVDARYFRKSVEVVYELGLKLCYVFWRRFDQSERDEADSKYNERCFELIESENYALAETLLSFSQGVPHLTEQIRKMMIVNLANSIKFQGRKEEASKLLRQHDWTAANDDFKICVEAVHGDTNKVIEKMRQFGKQIDAHNYRSWPVFREIRDDPKFLQTFEDIFGEPLIQNNLSKEQLVFEQIDTDQSLPDAKSLN